MVITRLEGGLGNQMFQYAAARGLSNKTVYLDTTFLDWQLQADYQTARNYELYIFKNLKAVRLSTLLFKFLQTERYAGIRNLFLPGLKHVQEQNHVFLNTLCNYKHIYLKGWFQNEKYFATKKQALLREFSFPELDDQNTETLNKIRSCDHAVSLHVRRGDYLSAGNRDYFETLPLEYYIQAMKRIESQTLNPQYFIFSDDTDWCKQSFSFLKDRCTIVANNATDAAWKDMKLMSQCRHHIIANSSFSWWGAWLSTKDGIKVAPKTWFNTATVNYSINHFVPESWYIVS